MKEVKFCFCGRVIQNEVCPVHKTFTKKPVRVRVGRWSGRSKNPEYGVNWNEKD